jgi:tRNA-specific 2-thiouridylase
MLRKADMLGAQWIATGHYADISLNPETQRFVLSRDSDNVKDQSYALWGLSQEHLSRTLFPLTGFTKERSRAEAERFGLSIAKKPESYEICFIPDNDYKRFMRDMVPDLDLKAGIGDIIMDGEVIGSHNGYHGYTVGQRKGLGISSPEPLYVLNVLADSNEIIVGKEDDLLSKELIAHSVNFIKYPTIEGTKTFTVKIRYKDEGAPAECTLLPDGRLHIVFQEARKAITPGQSIVLYEGNDVIGGGIIDRLSEHESSLHE